MKDGENKEAVGGSVTIVHIDVLGGMWRNKACVTGPAAGKLQELGCEFHHEDGQGLLLQ